MARNDGRTLAIVLLCVVVLSGCASGGTPRPTVATAAPVPTPTATAPPTPSLTPLPTLPPSFPMGLVGSWRATTVDSVAAIGSVDVEGDGQEEVWAASRDRYFYLLDAAGEQAQFGFGFDFCDPFPCVQPITGEPLLLTVVPEPTTLGFVAIGVLLLSRRHCATTSAGGREAPA